VVIILLLVTVSIKLIPKVMMAESRSKAAETPFSSNSKWRAVDFYRDPAFVVRKSLRCVSMSLENLKITKSEKNIYFG
jgi:hypothetical protein